MPMQRNVQTITYLSHASIEGVNYNTTQDKKINGRKLPKRQQINAFN